MFEAIFFTVLCILLLYFSILKKYSKRNDKRIKIQGPSLFEILGHVFRSRSGLDGLLQHLYSIQAKYGLTFCINIKPFSPILVTSDHNYFGQILASKEHVHKPSSYDVIKAMVGESLVSTYQIDIWRNDRKILNEVFGHDSFKMVLEDLDQKLHELDRIILEQINGPVDMQEVLHKFILHTTIGSLKDRNIAWDKNRTIEFKKSTNTYLNNAVKQSLTLMLNLDFLFKWTKTYRTQEEKIKLIRQYGMDMVDAHLENKETPTDTNNIIYRLHEAGVPYDRIVDNLLLFIEAAHETVATAIAFLLFEISKHPDIQNKICAEIESIIGKDPNATISVADIQQMKYLHCVVKEGLRMRSPVPYVMRKLHTSAEINNISIPEGTIIIFFIDALHKSEKYYKDPLVFNPDRFNAENQSNLTPNTWTPFALGTRNCIGTSLAMQKMKLILAKLVRKYQFSPVVPEHKLDVRSVFVTRSVNGVPVRIKVRDNW